MTPVSDDRPADLSRPRRDAGRSRARSGRRAACLAVFLGALLTATAFTTPARADDSSVDPVTPPAVDPVVSPAYDNTPLRFITYNAGAAVSVKGAQADLRALMAKQPSIVGLQEFASGPKRAWVRSTFVDCETCHYGGYMPAPAVPGGTPILYDARRFRLLRSGTVQVTKDTFVGQAGAGPATIRAKFINWITVRDLATGRSFSVLNNHAVPTVQGKGGGANRRMPKRLAIYSKHMAGLAALITQLREDGGGSVFVLGDFNVNYRLDRQVKDPVFPYAHLTPLGLAANWERLGLPSRGTHTLKGGNDTRLIDYVWSDQRAMLTPLTQEILEGFRSDHRPVVVTFQLSRLKGYTPPTEEDSTDAETPPPVVTPPDGTAPDDSVRG
ncbi:hypothetical protein [Nocardioides sp.]|uniref:hypothetical protein n=1 Tax=Nocardioides sp. TaxID=35761 RepID=UPI003519ACFB